MFQLHDRTRRRLALAAFLLVGVLPTVSLLAVGVARKLPGHVRHEAARLGTHLGLDVSLTGLGHPFPGVVRYRGLRLADPETGQTLLECDSLEARFRTVADGEARDRRELVITAGTTSVAADGLDSIRGLVNRVLRRRTGWPETDVRAAVTAIRCSGFSRSSPPEGGTANLLTDVEGHIATSSAGASAELRFRPPGTERPGTVLVRMVRNRRVRPPADAYTVDTGGVAVPCELLALGSAGFDGLGEESRFCGSLCVNESAEGLFGELTGQFLNVELEGLADQRLGYRLTGTAELSIERARFGGGRVVDAAGTLSAGPGAIGRSLVEAARRLGMTRGPDREGLAPSTAYQRLALAFWFDARGLRLRGTCSEDGQGIVAIGEHGPLLSDPAGRIVPLATIAAALASPGEIPFPVTTRTAWLLGR